MLLGPRTLAPTLLPPSTARPIAAHRWLRRLSGPVVRPMRSAEGRASRRAPDLHPTTVSRRRDNVDGFQDSRSSTRPSAHDANKSLHSVTVTLRVSSNQNAAGNTQPLQILAFWETLNPCKFWRSGRDWAFTAPPLSWDPLFYTLIQKSNLGGPGPPGPPCVFLFLFPPAPPPALERQAPH